GAVRLAHQGPEIIRRKRGQHFRAAVMVVDAVGEKHLLGVGEKLLRQGGVFRQRHPPPLRQREKHLLAVGEKLLPVRARTLAPKTAQSRLQRFSDGEVVAVFLIPENVAAGKPGFVEVIGECSGANWEEFLTYAK